MRLEHFRSLRPGNGMNYKLEPTLQFKTTRPGSLCLPKTVTIKQCVADSVSRDGALAGDYRGVRCLIEFKEYADILAGVEKTTKLYVEISSSCTGRVFFLADENYTHVIVKGDKNAD